MRSSTHAFHTITSFPLDPCLPLYEHYPAMKLGVRASIRHYAGLLAPLAQEILDGEPESIDWVLTAPPLYAVPSGANLIGWELYRILSASNPRLRCVDLRYPHPIPASGNLVDGSGDYARAGIDARIANRRMLLEGDFAPRPDPADFRDRAVLVINDINVTGTQQKFLERTLAVAQPASIHWLYLIQVDPVLGQSHPELEYSLNHLTLGTVKEFAEVLKQPDIDYTARCIKRLFDSPAATLDMLLRSMDKPCLQRLHQLLIDEGTYTGNENEGLALLRKYAS